MFKRKLAKVIVSLLRRIANVSRAGAKRLMRAMLRSLMAMGRRAKLPVAGFVLPTVTMVMLVVVLLTLAITLRSFDRAQNARNVRVNQQVLAAATPALERARAKIEYLLNEDPTRPTGTPSDISIKRALSKPTTGTDTYTFNDEIRLRVGYKLNRNTLSTASWDSNADLVENKEVINTAWRFPVDTDNNGKFDSYTIYGIYFRSPPRDGDNAGTTAGQFLTERKPLETRTPPMPGSLGSAQCAAALGTSASLVGDSGWYQSDGKLKKSFFVYTVTVPITDSSPAAHNASIDATQLEQYKGTKGFSALEYQQDRLRLPLLNNAVVYEDDLEISPGAAFRLNGAMLTNSNLLVTSTGASTVDLFLISGQNSCYYKQENSKIIVAGNVVNGASSGVVGGTSTVHLFQGSSTAPITGGGETTIGPNQSVTDAATAVLYNNEAYANRISRLVTEVINDPGTYPPANDPTSVQKARAGGKDRSVALQTYFENLTRKVPFSEVTDVTTDTPPSPLIQGSGDTLHPHPDWALPLTTGLTLQPNQLKAQNPNPTGGGAKPTTEDVMGDRIIVGNNLPTKWWDDTTNKFITEQNVTGGKWTPDDGTTRTRKTQKQTLAEVGVTNRGDFWEKAAAQKPINPLSAIGGLRVITGAGVYERLNSFLPPPRLKNDGTVDPYDDLATTDNEGYEVVWPDSMPMSPVAGSKVFDNSQPVATTTSWVDLPTTLTPAGTGIDPNTPKYAKGDLRMRATAVYHYAQDAYEPDSVPVKETQAPIACISSYYDPTDSITAKNTVDDPLGKSNNGIVYPPPYPISANPPRPAAGTLTPGSRILAGTPQALYDQANMVFPDGKFANEQLRTALMKDEVNRNLAEQAAIDSTMCAFGILGTSGFTALAPLPGGALPSGGTIPNGAIREVTLLNSREIKAIDADDLTTPLVDETFTLSSPTGAGAAKLNRNYNLALEERMPLEIRVTQIDLNQLRNQIIPFASSINGPSPEYLLPNSGIIYASRDDAAPDRSDRTADAANDPVANPDKAVIPYGIDAVKSNIISKTDSRLDPTRRPHGIMLINGGFLARNDADNDGQNDTAPSNVADVVKEKGLTLVSNLPVYVQGNFNQHSQEEFGAVGNLAQPGWGNFYTRALPLNPNFACRPGDPRLPNCTTGDTWRAATVLADAVTVLSPNFRPGFRNEGDFDLRNNAGQAIVGYDFNIPADGIKSSDPTVDETIYNIDFNGDGDQADTNVKETEVTAKAARLLNGFYNNNFVTNGLSSGGFTFNAGDIRPGVPSATVTLTDAYYISNPDPAQINSSYFNNFVTPVQRRGDFPEYVMEMCRKLPVSSCGPTDWEVGYQGVASVNETYELIGIAGFDPTQLTAGTTARPPINAADQRYPRRIAFLRWEQASPGTSLVISTGANTPIPGALVLQGSAPNLTPIPLGIAGADSSAPTAGTLGCYSYTADLIITTPSPITCPTYGATPPARPRRQANALWFRTTTNTTTPASVTTTDWNYTDSNPLYYKNTLTANARQHPQLAPVLQIHVTTTGDPTQAQTNQTNINNTKWLPRAEETTFNLVVGSGDNPARAVGNDFNGGMQNLTRFLENWSGVNTKILGSFIQLSRSAYATAPYTAILSPPPPAGLPSIFSYPNVYSINNNSNRTPNFSPPQRQWGYDVGLLSQSPDLFTQLFTTPPTKTNSDEFFREVGRDDVWVKTLLCAKKDETPTENAISNDQRPTQFCDDNPPGDWNNL